LKFKKLKVEMQCGQYKLQAGRMKVRYRIKPMYAERLEKGV